MDPHEISESVSESVPVLNESVLMQADQGLKPHRAGLL